MELLTDPDRFIWATGIEDTFVQHARGRQRPLDEYELMGHYQYWREHLALVPRAGAGYVRWGVPWYRIEPEEGLFVWEWTDQVLPHLVETLGITPIIDLVHYGCPLWMPRAFDDPRYPAAVARFATAFARRYRDLVHWYTPLNEPHMTAWMCGQQGAWPPYMRGERGYLRVAVQAARGIVRTVQALREVDPDAIIVQVEAAAVHRAAGPDLQEFADEERRRRFLSYDLIDGRVTTGHPLYTWLLRNGTRPDHLQEIAQNRCDLDVMGLNFYPQWSTHQIYVSRRGNVRFRNTEPEGDGFLGLIEDYWQRYHTPIMITETSAYGSEETRIAWLRASLNAVKRARSHGIPVVGYTWFPLFTMIDWRYRNGNMSLEDCRIELGLFRVTPGGPAWEGTAVADCFRECSRNSDASIGEFLPNGDTDGRAEARPLHAPLPPPEFNTI